MPPRRAGAARPVRGSGVVEPSAQLQEQQLPGTGGPEATMVPYERERLERISKNRQVLEELGLNVAPPLLAKPASKPRAQRRAEAESAPELLPTRKSKRQRGEAPEIQAVPQPRDRPRSEEVRAAHAAVSASRSKAAGAEPAEMDAHNAYRCGVRHPLPAWPTLCMLHAPLAACMRLQTRCACAHALAACMRLQQRLACARYSACSSHAQAKPGEPACSGHPH
jgi:hypothetical protein